MGVDCMILHMTKQTKKELAKYKLPNESYNDVIDKLLDLEDTTHTVHITYE